MLNLNRIKNGLNFVEDELRSDPEERLIISLNSTLDNAKNWLDRLPKDDSEAFELRNRWADLDKARIEANRIEEEFERDRRELMSDGDLSRLEKVSGELHFVERELTDLFRSLVLDQKSTIGFILDRIGKDLDALPESILEIDRLRERYRVLNAVRNEINGFSVKAEDFLYRC